MNHCKTPGCGRRVTDGGTQRNSEQRRCLLCLQAKVMRDWRYVSPAMKRWRKRALLTAREG